MKIRNEDHEYNWYEFLLENGQFHPIYRIFESAFILYIATSF